jgi:putative glutamine amidotransferase
MKLVIGLSYAPESESKYLKYGDAVRTAAKNLDYEVEVTDLSSFPEKIETIDGIIFTGGADVNPSFYNRADLLELCDELDQKRDELELGLADKADARNLPILGICRGLQLLNVHYGGTLIADMPSAGLPSHSKIPQPDGSKIDRIHTVHVEADTLLKKITKTLVAPVTSAHHQAIDKLADGMTASARSVGDDVIEAIEWKEPKDRPYFLALQWHPERMDYDEELSGAIFESFLWEVASRKMLAKRL